MRRTGLLALGLLIAGLAVGGWLLSRAAQPVPPLQPTRLFEQVLTHVRRFGVDSLPETDLYRRAADGLLWQLDDEYATLVPAGVSAADLDRPDPGGFGLLLATRDDRVRVLGVLPGSSADRAGVEPGDVLLELNDRSLQANRRDELRAILSGPGGTKAVLRLRRPGIAPLIETTLVRDRPVAAVVPPGVVLDPAVGYVAIPLLGNGATGLVRGAADSLLRLGVTRLILDLRGASGGTLSEAVALAGLFLPAGTTVVEVRARSPEPRRLATDGDPAFPLVPLAIVVDSGTADAAEAFAGALQDADRALVLGEPTFGRGLSPEIFPLSERITVRLSTGRWVTPVGRVIQRDTASSDTLARRPTLATPGGRLLRAGGGIVPDSLVPVDTLSEAERTLLRAIGAKLPEYRDTLAAISTDPAFSVGQAARDRLAAAMESAGFAVTRAQLAAAAGLLDRQLQEAALFRSGDQAARFAWQARRHPAVQRALAVLRAAASPAAVVGLEKD